MLLAGMRAALASSRDAMFCQKMTAIAAMSLLAAALACWSLRGSFLYVAGALTNLATTIGWLQVWRPSRGAVEVKHSDRPSEARSPEHESTP